MERVTTKLTETPWCQYANKCHTTAVVHTVHKVLSAQGGAGEGTQGTKA